jgi:hypothetical protein
MRITRCVRTRSAAAVTQWQAHVARLRRVAKLADSDAEAVGRIAVFVADRSQESAMTTTPMLWKSLTQVNTSDSGPDGVAQGDGQVVALKDGGYVVVWADNSGAYNSNGTAVMGQRYNSAGNKVGGEVHLTSGFPGSCFQPAVTLLGDGNLAVAFVNEVNGDDDIYVRIFKPSLIIGRTDFIKPGQRRRSPHRSPP